METKPALKEQNINFFKRLTLTFNISTSAYCTEVMNSHCTNLFPSQCSSVTAKLFHSTKVEAEIQLDTNILKATLSI